VVLVLDTRFLLTHTFPPTEDDRRKLRDFSSKIAREGLIIPPVVIAEFMRLAGPRIGREAAEARLRLWISTCAKVLEVGEEESFIAGRMALSYRRVPLADILIGAVAKSLRASVVSDDPHFFELGVKTLWYK